METEFGIGTRVEHPHYGKGVIVVVEPEYYTVWFKSQHETKIIAKDLPGIQLVEAAAQAPIDKSVMLEDIEEALERIIDRRLAEDTKLTPMALKWNKGTLILKPSDTAMQNKEIPIETFFHKIVMVRDKLRVMEQKINANKVLTDEEKVDLQQYITGIYGSLTTFNVLFREANHQFKGAGGKE